jgi:uncharacterized membrane-anchored protein
MSRKFRLAFVIIVAAQVLLLLGFIADREYTLQTGDEVVLETLPIDPRSLLQGDFVIFDYVIASLPSDSQFSQGATVFVSLNEGEEVWEAESYTLRKPSDSDTVFIKGTVDRPEHLDFGLGTYFIPEGSGPVIERSLDVKVVAVVDRRGKAAIKDVLVDGVPFDEARAVEEEFRLRTNSEVILETAPPGPKTILEGEFAIFNYVIAELPSNSDNPVGTTMYVILRESGGVWEAENYSTSEPSGSEVVFITGVIDQPGHLDFGIGTFGLPGSGELFAGEFQDVKVVVSVDGRGKAAINDVLLDGASIRGPRSPTPPPKPVRPN